MSLLTATTNADIIESNTVSLASVFGVPDEQDMRIISREQLEKILDETRSEGYCLGLDRAKSIVTGSARSFELETYK